MVFGTVMLAANPFSPVSGWVGPLWIRFVLAHSADT